MAISIQCPSCGSALQVRENLAGKSGKCPKCAGIINFPVPSAASGQSQPGRRTPGNRVRVALAGLRDGAYRSACALRPYLWTGAAALAVLCVLALVLRFGIGRHSDVEPAQVAGDGELTRLESQLSELKQQLADQKAASEASKPVAAVAGNWLTRPRRDLRLPRHRTMPGRCLSALPKLMEANQRHSRSPRIFQT